MHHKNKKPKKYKGHCGMCAVRDHDMGIRNKRNLTLQELRANITAREEGLNERKYKVAG